MKTLRILSLLIVAALMFSCEKDIKDEEKTGEVSFGIEHIDPLELKSDAYDIECPTDLEPVKAKIVISGVNFNQTFYPEVFFLNGRWHTQSIKLPVGDYEIEEFYLLGPDDTSDPNNPVEVILMATPAEGSDYAPYVEFNTVVKEFTVEAFKKEEIKMWVLCYEEAAYDAFGFFWFRINRIVVREKCFFGDLCIKDLTDYAGSLYANQENGVQLDMPAIFEIRAFSKEIDENDEEIITLTPLPYSPFSNEGIYGENDEGFNGEGAPLCVQWPDNIDIDGEVFHFELWVYVAVGSSFDYVHFHTWTFEDDELLDEGGADDVIDFVLGSCNYSYTDLQLAPYQNLPTTAGVSIAIDTDNPFANGAYWALTVTSLSPAGSYDFPPVSDDIYLGWCGSNVNIDQGAGTFFIYSSLNDANWPNNMPTTVTIESLAKVNWLFNNLPPEYPTLDEMFIYEDDWNNVDPDDAKALQHAIWKLLGINSLASNVVGGSDFPFGNAMNMVNDANTWATNNGVFVPLPGGYAATLMVKADVNGNPDPANNQLIFTVVDP